jgi:hypothetical protein
VGASQALSATLLSSWEVLSSPARSGKPEEAILTAALDGKLTAEKLAELAPVAASAAATASYLRGLADSSAHVLLGEWHRQVKAGGADQILDSLRKNFDAHAKAIEHARSLISAESSAEHVIESGEPELVRAWQGLNEHIRAVTQIAAVASQFGPRLGNFPQITEFSLGENARLDDRAIMCTAGPLVIDSALFGRPDQGHRTSPFFRTTLKLHSIAEAQARYDTWAAEEFDRVHSGPRGGWIGEDGRMHEHPRPTNPYRTKVST